jgi:CBS domain-containing protein
MNARNPALVRNFKVDSVSRLNPAPPLCIAPHKSVIEAVELMRRERVGCLLVCEGERLLGIFTERDLLQRVLAANQPLSRPVSEFMTPDPVKVHAKESISAAVRHMEVGGYRHLPVVDKAGLPVGLLSVKRIVHYLVEHFPGTVYNLPPDPSVVPQEREGA